MAASLVAIQVGVHIAVIVVELGASGIGSGFEDLFLGTGRHEGQQKQGE